MTRERTKELLPFMQAYAEGKTVQFLRADGQWEDTTHPWDGGNIRHEFRVKPEPREFWIEKWPKHGHIWTSREDAEAAIGGNRNGEIIHVREVLP